MFIVDEERAALHRAAIELLTESLLELGADARAVVSDLDKSGWSESGAVDSYAITGWPLTRSRRVRDFYTRYDPTVRRRTVLFGLGDGAWDFLSGVASRSGTPTMLLLPSGEIGGRVARAHARFEDRVPVLWWGPTQHALTRAGDAGIPSSSMRLLPWPARGVAQPRNWTEIGGTVSIAMGGPGLDARAWIGAIQGVARAVRAREDTVVFLDSVAVRRARLWPELRRCGLDESASVIPFEGQSRELVLRSDFLLLPDAPEHRMSLLVGAMAKGACVLAVDTGAGGLLEHNSNALLIPEITRADAGNWGSALGGALDNPSLTARISSAAAAHASEHHSLDRCLRALMDGCAWLIGERSIPFADSGAGG